MLKTFFKVFAIILAVIYVFSFILSISVMYASNALISSRYHIRVDLNNSNNNNKIETSFYAKDEIVEEDEYTYSILSEKSFPYQITIDEYDMSEDLIVKIDVLKNNGETLTQEINLDKNRTGSLTKLGYTIDCETGEITNTPENINENDIAKTMQERLAEIILMIRNVSFVCMILCIIVCFIIK